MAQAARWAPAPRSLLGFNFYEPVYNHGFLCTMHPSQNKWTSEFFTHPLGLSLWSVCHWAEPLTTTLTSKIQKSWSVSHLTETNRYSIVVKMIIDGFSVTETSAARESAHFYTSSLFSFWLVTVCSFSSSALFHTSSSVQCPLWSHSTLLYHFFTFISSCSVLTAQCSS